MKMNIKSINSVILSVLIFTVILLISGCSGSSPEIDKENVPGLYMDSSLPVSERVESLLSLMTLEEKVGQMLQVDRFQISYIGEISENLVGSVLNGGNSNPVPNTPQGWLKMYNEVQEEAMKTRLAIPVLYGIDAVHGNGRTPGAVVFPHNIGLGAAGSEELAELAGRITAVETRATGVHWTFAPCIAVPQDIRWGRTYEGFSEDPETVSRLGQAMIRGMQMNGLSDFSSIAACAKHYAADGGTEGGTDQGNSVMNEQELRDIHLYPYKAAIEQGVATIMASYSSWNGQKLHGSEYLLKEVLRNELGFEGLLVSDWGAVRQLPGDLDDQLGKSINAGIDLLMLPSMPSYYLSTILDLVQEGRIEESRINEAVSRILKLKFELGLFENPFADPEMLSVIGSDEHREAARRAVRESLVVLKNFAGVLPLDNGDSVIALAGPKADNTGVQCGGWTLIWQGKSGDIKGGTSIFDAFRQRIKSDDRLIFSEDGKLTGKADVIVAVVGENPYAEGKGDSKNPGISEKEAEMLESLYKYDVPVIVIVLSGRPVLMTEQIEKADAVIAAWLPGTEAQGIADVIFGDYGPAGKLSYSWPKDESFFTEREDSNTLFPFGYGLTW